MKDLYTILRALKRISPDSGYAASSRSRILATSQLKARRITVADIFRHVGSFAMAGLALVGCVSLVRAVLPAAPVSTIPHAPLNQQALSAEAGAIDAQLALADVQYQTVSQNTADTHRTISTVAANVAKSAAGGSVDGQVDRALLALSQ